MLEKMMNSYVIFWAMGVVVVLGIICKMVTAATLKRIVKASSKMGKSTHKLMKLVKAKFEHTYMLSDRVENTRTFVEKYLYEYKVLGFRLHSWRYFGRQMIWLCGFLGFAGALFSYRYAGMVEITFQYAAIGATGMVILFLIRVCTDEAHQLEAVQMYMIDYLDNVCAPRYGKQQALKQQRMENIMQETVMEPESVPVPVTESEEEINEEISAETSVVAESRMEEEAADGPALSESELEDAVATAMKAELNEREEREEIQKKTEVRNKKEARDKAEIEKKAEFLEKSVEMLSDDRTIVQPERTVPQEVILREILEEFLA